MLAAVQRKTDYMQSRVYHPRQAGKILLEAIVVAAIGIAFGLAANYVSPRGLGLNHNYFPGQTPASGTPGSEATTLPVPAGGTNYTATNSVKAPESSVAARLRQNGLQIIDSAGAWRLFNDPRYQQHLVVFVDARDDEHYEKGHIPGAVQFDHYHLENYLGAALSACLPAEQVVVYCNGGDCEDSEYAAIVLRDAGVPNQKLFVYAGGITEWTANHYPVEGASAGRAPVPEPGAGK